MSTSAQRYRRKPLTRHELQESCEKEIHFVPKEEVLAHTESINRNFEGALRLLAREE